MTQSNSFYIQKMHQFVQFISKESNSLANKLQNQCDQAVIYNESNLTKFRSLISGVKHQLYSYKEELVNTFTQIISQLKEKLQTVLQTVNRLEDSLTQQADHIIQSAKEKEKWLKKLRSILALKLEKNEVQDLQQWASQFQFVFSTDSLSQFSQVFTFQIDRAIFDQLTLIGCKIQALALTPLTNRHPIKKEALQVNILNREFSKDRLAGLRKVVREKGQDRPIRFVNGVGIYLGQNMR